MGDCRHCGKPAGFLRRKHGACASAHEQGLAEMRSIAAEAAAGADFNKAALHGRLAAIAADCWASETDIEAAIATGWARSVKESLADGVLTREEETRLRDFRDQMAIAASASTEVQLERAAKDRLTQSARQAALAVGEDGTALGELDAMLDESQLAAGERRRLLVDAWEQAVEHTLEDGLLSLEEEAALVRYLRRFGLSAEDVDANGVRTNMVQAAVIREVAEGLVPERQNVGAVPFNLMKSEQLVWVIDDVDYSEVVTRRERRGTSHGVSIRIAKGLYYSPRTFRSQSHEWEETVHVDSGLLGVTTKHIYFHGPRKRFRIRFDRIVSFEPYSDGIGVMRDAQTAKPQNFVTGDGWFIYNLVTNLAQR